MMTLDIQGIHKLILHQIPRDVTSFLVQHFILTYQTSHDSVFNNQENEQGIDLLYHHRRASIESFLKLLPNHFPEIKTECKINDSKNHYHVEVSINDIVFTQSFTQFPDEKVREAKFRNSLSDYNKQIEMNLDGSKSISISTEEKKIYYAILKHGAEGRKPQRPQFFQLVLPTNDSEVTIDLLQLYDISPKVFEAQIEDIKSGEALLNPKLKKLPKTGESNSE